MSKELTFFVMLAKPLVQWKAQSALPTNVKDVLAMLALAQVADETGWNLDNVLARPPAHNMSGIKFHLPKYGAISEDTFEDKNGERVPMVAEFQIYPDAAAWFEDYISIQTSSLAVMNAIPLGWEAACDALGPWTADDHARMDATPPEAPLHSNYATDPQYSTTLKEIIAEWHLDDPRALPWYASGASLATEPDFASL